MCECQRSQTPKKIIFQNKWTKSNILSVRHSSDKCKKVVKLVIVWMTASPDPGLYLQFLSVSSISIALWRWYIFFLLIWHLVVNYLFKIFFKRFFFGGRDRGTRSPPNGSKLCGAIAPRNFLRNKARTIPNFSITVRFEWLTKSEELIDFDSMPPVFY